MTMSSREDIDDPSTRSWIAGELPVRRLGFGVMQLPDPGVWGPPADRDAALAWLLARSPVVLPIPGTSAVDHLEDNVAAAGLRLGADEVAALSAQAA